MSSDTLQLTDEHYIGKGNVQACYQHPANESLCVKVAIDNRKPALGKINKELKYYNVLAKKDIRYDIIPKYYGKVNTNLGEASVFDLVKDFDGNIAKSLLDYLADKDFLNENYDKLVAGMRSLRDALLEQKIITLSIHTPNILCKKNEDGSLDLVIIDNLGSKAFFPLEYYLDFIATVRIKRRWRDFLEVIKQECKHPLMEKLTQELVLE